MKHISSNIGAELTMHCFGMCELALCSPDCEAIYHASYTLATRRVICLKQMSADTQTKRERHMDLTE